MNRTTQVALRPAHRANRPERPSRWRRWLILPILIILTVTILIMLTLKLPVFGARPTAEDKQRFSSSAAFDAKKGVFQNRRPELYQQMRDEMKLIPMLREWFSERKDGRPLQALPEQQPDMDRFLSPSESVRLIWFGHSTFLLNIDGTIVLIDPVFGKTAAPVSFTAKRFQPPVLPLSQLPPVDVVLISHDHYDHLDADSIRFFRDAKTQFLVPLGIGGHLKRWGISEERIVERDWWESWSAHGIDFTAAPAQHFSGRDGFNNNETLWASWVMSNEQTRLFFSGDSGYDTHFAQIGERLGPFDLALMENGQYDDSWPVVHMRPFETIQAFREVNAKRLLPIHWGMFELAFHSWYAPAESLATLADEQGVDLVTPMFGEMLTLDDDLTTTRWWQNRD